MEKCWAFTRRQEAGPAVITFSMAQTCHSDGLRQCQATMITAAVWQEARPRQPRTQPLFRYVAPAMCLMVTVSIMLPSRSREGTLRVRVTPLGRLNEPPPALRRFLPGFQVVGLRCSIIITGTQCL